MRKWILFLTVLLLSCTEVLAKSNALIGLKIQPLPNNQLRMDFQFAKDLKQTPASFMTQKPPRLVLDFVDSSSQLTPDLQAKTVNFGSVNNYQIVAVGQRVRAILDLSAAVSYSGLISGRVYSLMINGIGNEPISRSKELFVTHRTISAKHKISKVTFGGKRISLNFQDIQLRAVLQLLADFTGVNVVVSDKVNGNIALRLNDVPWDQAMDIILTTQGLKKRQVGNVLLIDTAKEFNARESSALKEEEAAKKLAPIRSDLLQINYAKAADIASMLKDKNNSLLSDRGALSVDVRTNTIWLQDTGARIEEIRDLVSKLDIPVKQVSIEARIVDLKKDCAEDLGVRWGVSKPKHLSGTIEGANELAGGTAASAVPLAERLNLDLIAAPASGATPASVGVALAKLGSGVLLDLELSALESEGRAEIIASPRLMTTNQQPALIESGEDIPYQESTSSGATAVAFKKAVLSLKVTPQITPDGKLLMDLQINQDADSGQRVKGVPIILTKSIDTTVLVNNGQTIVLGGIYQQDKNNSVKRVPFLGQIPVLGHLFSSKQTSTTNEELLIFITPRIIANSMSITTVDGGRQQPSDNALKLDQVNRLVRVPANYVK